MRSTFAVSILKRGRLVFFYSVVKCLSEIEALLTRALSLTVYFQYFSLSTSTLSLSSSSSRGSVSTGSRGSLNSLVGWHGNDTVNGLDHYSYLAPSSTCPPIYEQSIYSTKGETTKGLSTINATENPSNSRVSLNSLSPPISPLTTLSYNDVANSTRVTSYGYTAVNGSSESLNKNVSKVMSKVSPFFIRNPQDRVIPLHRYKGFIYNKLKQKCFHEIDIENVTPILTCSSIFAVARVTNSTRIQ